MGKIKIHELAKELGLPSKEVLEQAKKIGIEVSSHLSNIEDKQAEQIKNAFSKTTKKKKDNMLTVRLYMAFWDKFKKENAEENAVTNEENVAEKINVSRQAISN